MTSDITQSIQSDINRFTQALQQWSTTYTKHITDTQTQHTTTTDKTQQHINTIQHNKENTSNMINEQKSSNAQQLQLNTNLINETNSIQHILTQLPKKQQLLQSTQTQYQSLINQLTQQITQLQETKQKTMNDIVYGISIFKNVLGIQFDVLQQPRGVLRITYKYINTNQPNELYSIDIYVNEHEQYVLQQSSHTISNIEQLIQQLNKYNRFDLFVMNVRIAFQNSVNQ